MNNFERIIEDFQKYSENHDLDFPESINSNLVKSSYDMDHNVNVYNNEDSNLRVLDMDVFTQNIYYQVYGKGIKDNILNSPDALLVNDENHWFLIEFKNSKISASNKKTKDSIIKKALCIIYSLTDVLLETRKEEILSNYPNPLKFFKDNVTYILVCSNDKNPIIAERNISNNRLEGFYGYTPEFMQKLVSYFFKDAYVYTEKYFEREFVKSFQY